MASSQRLFDRGTALGRTSLARLGRELRDARRDRGLSLDVVARAAGTSISELSRIERGQSPRVPLLTLHRCAAVVGLDLSSRLYPGSGPLRDGAHAELLADFRAHLHPSIRCATEVPMPIPGDRRAWDAFVSRAEWRYGVEAETSPSDAQALNRRLQLKARDAAVDGVLLVLRDRRRSRSFVREALVELASSFPIAGARAFERLRAGADPGGSAVLFVPYRRNVSRPTAQRAGPTSLRAGLRSTIPARRQEPAC